MFLTVERCVLAMATSEIVARSHSGLGIETMDAGGPERHTLSPSVAVALLLWILA